MTTIRSETVIHAPADRCFMLSLSIDLHLAGTLKTGERAVAGVTSGVMQLGDQATWEARDFGVRQPFTSKITCFDRPVFFQDTMLSGAFSAFQHDHAFRESNRITSMIDELRFQAPLGFLGGIAERVVLKSYLSKFLRERNRVIREAAESDDWKKYLPLANDHSR